MGIRELFPELDIDRYSEIPIDHINRVYLVDESGNVFSLILRRKLKKLTNSCGYHYYRLKSGIDGKTRTYFAHTLVCTTFNGTPPSDKHEINHIDHDKTNNHYSNLEWVTHSENIKKSYTDGGRTPYWSGKKRGSTPDSTKKKMAAAKHKRVRLLFMGNEIGVFKSIQDLCDFMRWDRKVYFRLRRGEYKKYIGILEVEDASCDDEVLSLKDRLVFKRFFIEQGILLTNA